MGKMNRIEESYRANGNAIRAWMARSVGAETAEDLLQDVFARAAANLDSLEPVRDLAAWLWRAARNALIDAWRTRRRRSARRGEVLGGDGLEELIQDYAPEPADAYEKEELLLALERAIGDLPPEQREVIVAQALGGESFRSISERTGVPADTLAARKRYALAKLRSALARHYEE